MLSVASDLTYAWRAAVTSPGSDTNPENHTLLHRPPQTNPMANPRTIPTAGILTHLGFQRIDFADSVSRERAEGSRHARSVHRCHSNLQVYAGPECRSPAHRWIAERNAAISQRVPRPSTGIHFDGGRKIGSQRSSGGSASRALQRFRNNAAGGSSGKWEKQISARKKSRARQACNPSA